MTTETLMTATTTTDGTAATTSDDTTQSTATTAQSEQGAEQSTQQQTETTTQTKAEETKQPGAPEKYEFKFEEGKALPESTVTGFSAVAKELNLTQEAAQTILDRMAPIIAQNQTDQLAAARTSWAEAAMADGEFGGAKFKENIAMATKAMEHFASSELKTLLNETGLGNHPEVVRVFVKIGKAISEDSLVTQTKGTRSTAPMDDAARAKALYPSMN